jgi:hypothetical protein
MMMNYEIRGDTEHLRDRIVAWAETNINVLLRSVRLLMGGEFKSMGMRDGGRAGGGKSRRPVQQVIDGLRSSPANGTFDEVAARHLWDEYCWALQEGPFDDDMVIENVNLGSLSSGFDDVARGYIQTEVEKLPRHAQVFLSALAFEKDDREEETLGSIWVEGIVNLILEDLNQHASCRNLDLIGPHRNEVIGYEIEGSGMVWSVLYDRDEALDLIAGHADAIIDPDGDLSDLAKEMVDAFMVAMEEADSALFFEFMERFGSNMRSLLHENDVLPCLKGIRADLLDTLDA